MGQATTPKRPITAVVFAVHTDHPPNLTPRNLETRLTAIEHIFRQLWKFRACYSDGMPPDPSCGPLRIACLAWQMQPSLQRPLVEQMERPKAWSNLTTTRHSRPLR
eukprot:3352498-Amphidinium_carterae.2